MLGGENALLVEVSVHDQRLRLENITTAIFNTSYPFIQHRVEDPILAIIFMKILTQNKMVNFEIDLS